MGLYDLVPPSKPIDYEAMKREHPKAKAALTRAKRSGDPVRVVRAVSKALDAFDAIGCWPDDWSLWRIAMEDAWNDFVRSDAYFKDRDGDGKLAREFQTCAARFR